MISVCNQVKHFNCTGRKNLTLRYAINYISIKTKLKIKGLLPTATATAYCHCHCHCLLPLPTATILHMYRSIICSSQSRFSSCFRISWVCMTHPSHIFCGSSKFHYRYYFCYHISNSWTDHVCP